MRSNFKTLYQWKQAHPHVNVLAFEANYDKESGFGDWEEVCGFCLASHYFEKDPPEICRFCRAPIRETEIISDLPEVVKRVWSIAPIALPIEEDANKLMVVWRKAAEKSARQKLSEKVEDIPF